MFQPPLSIGSRLVRRAATGVMSLSRYDGVNHGFMFWVGLVDKARAAMDEACKWLRGVFSDSS
jgi:hypothetical protein